MTGIYSYTRTSFTSFRRHILLSQPLKLCDDRCRKCCSESVAFCQLDYFKIIN